MQRFLRYVKGTVTIKVIGYSLQRFMNLCSVKGIELKKVQIYDGFATMELYLRDIYDIKPIVRKTKMKVVLLEKKGLPFSMKKWKKRTGFFIGLCLCFILIYSLSLFIWDIELIGGVKMTTPFLISYLQDEGVGYGTLITKIDTEGLEKALRAEYPYIKWTDVSISGTKLVIAVKENDQVEDNITKEETPCDLYATVNGTVNSIVTRSGIPQVTLGQSVQSGEKLVSGQIPIMNDDDTVRNYLYTHSDADIYLDTEFVYEKEIPYIHEVKAYTGEEKCLYYMKLYQKSFSLGFLPQSGEFDIVTDLKQAKLFKDFYLPVYYGKIYYKKYEIKKLKYTESEIKQVLNEGLDDFCKSLSQKGIQIIDKNVTIKDNQKKRKMKAIVTVRVKDGEVVEIKPENNQNGEHSTEGNAAMTE